jgi:hypothetical protein
MSLRSFVFPVLALFAALPALAQETGGMALRGPAAMLERIEQLQPGCRLSQTSVTIGVNRASGAHSQARQDLLTMAPGGCRPLVSTQVVAGANLGLGPAATPIRVSRRTVRAACLPPTPTPVATISRPDPAAPPSSGF